MSKPKGGRTRRANYATTVMRIPIPIQAQVEALIEEFHRENEAYQQQPTSGCWWEILGVSPRASQDEVKAAYRQLAQQYHPDVNKRLDAHQRAVAVNMAYEQYCQLARSR